MTTKIALTPLEFRFSLLFGFFLALAPFTQAQSPNQLLVFTEYSDTMLTATIGGVAAGTAQLNGSPDTWIWALGISGHFSGGEILQWTEPEGGTAVNYVSNFNLPTGDELGIISDTNHLTLPPNFFPANGTIFRSGLTFFPTSGAPIVYDVQFQDLSDSASVPDYCTTFNLLAVSTFGLFGVSQSRWRNPLCLRK